MVKVVIDDFLFDAARRHYFVETLLPATAKIKPDRAGRGA
jgi:hypothetical protein